MRVTSDQAFDLADAIRECSKAVGDRLAKDWDGLTPAQRTTLENDEFDLLTLASTVRVKAVGIVVAEASAAVADLQKSTARAKNVIKTIGGVKQLIGAAAAVVGLAAALASRQPAAVVGALAELGLAIAPEGGDAAG